MLNIAPWRFTGYVAAYLVFSLITFVVTAGGTIKAVYLELGFYFYTPIILGVVLASATLHRNGRTVLLKCCNLWTLGALGAFQLVMLLGNHGDCGAGEGVYTFYDTLRGVGAQLCNAGAVQTEPLATLYGLYLYVYAITLVSVLVFIYNRSFTQQA